MNLTLSFYTTFRFMRMGFENILDERVQIDSTQLVDGYLMCVEKHFSQVNSPHIGFSLTKMCVFSLEFCKYICLLVVISFA